MVPAVIIPLIALSRQSNPAMTVTGIATSMCTLLISSVMFFNVGGPSAKVADVRNDYGAETTLLSIGYVCFMGFVPPQFSWPFLLVPLLLLLTSLSSAAKAAAFFPYGFVRCAQYVYFVLACIRAVYLQVRSGTRGLNTYR